MESHHAISIIEKLKANEVLDENEERAVTESSSKFLQMIYSSDITKLLSLHLDEGKHHSIQINAQDFIHHCPELAFITLHFPSVLIPLLDKALILVQSIIFDKEKTTPCKNLAVKHLCHVRINNIPKATDLFKQTISNIRNNDLDKLIQIEGTVIRNGLVKMLEVYRFYKCMYEKCGNIFSVECDMSQGNVIVPPKSCISKSKNSPKFCRSSKFQEYGDRKLNDYQEIKVQEQVQKLGVGSIPRSIVVVLSDDLVDRCKAGDEVVITGQLIRKWNPVYPESKCTVQMVLKANSVKVLNNTEGEYGFQLSDELIHEFEGIIKKYKNQPIKLRNVLVASVCPQIYGLFAIKLAVLLTMIGGITETDPQGMKKRGTSHLLLIGDPGCGKSQFLRFAHKLSPRSVITTGIGTTSAGLTCTASKDGGEWMLEAGALVLADRGVCCIDEFSAIKEHDRATIHEAMEQQTLSIAKAGLVCKLNTRTCVFAVTNPKGSYDLDASVTINTAIGSPLLSRFDLILLLLDTKDQEWDNVVSTFILREAIDDKKSTKHSKFQKTKPIHINDEEYEKTPFSIEKLQKYIAWVKEKCPVAKLTNEAEAVLQSYYRYQRKCDNKAAPKTTIRLLESLIRISQAHARLLCRKDVLLMDAVQSVLCMEASLQSCSLMGSNSIILSNFPKDPDEEFMRNQRILLDKLGLYDLQCSTEIQMNGK